MSPLFDLSRPNRKIHAGVILLNSTTEILDIAPFHIMGGLSDRAEDLPDSAWPRGMKDQAMDIECHWVNETGKPAQLTSNMSVNTTDTFSTCPPLDIVLMGANKMDYIPTSAELEFARKSYESCQAFIAACGAFRTLLLAGLLDGKTATAPSILLRTLREEHPQVTWLEKRWHQDGKIWTTGTLVNGLDAMRAFVHHTWGGQGGLAEHLLTTGN
ncbi:hypothetical protein M409DRAFT_20624 [Zasmidium cellare ATCC 36951]|uniref:DJ-1/PfpI domain-containing protein n=1 Tax=Zasmidium cellare ATCC 36951 TaxID=1080233 RepID=A0A6A6CQN8_ZASCE|nr:uncharacterized protein M409DRAFT_20624 [Zasmidium cellare ATCC 36951]KAF2169405.1 hypothetical protein M409DRAFT_20624 [Zasmidium cellare ATCC 36951]